MCKIIEICFLIALLSIVRAVKITENNGENLYLVAKPKVPKRRPEIVDFSPQIINHNNDDAIRIVEPPRYFQDQKRHYFQRPPHEMREAMASEYNPQVVYQRDRRVTPEQQMQHQIQQQMQHQMYMHQQQQQPHQQQQQPHRNEMSEDQPQALPLIHAPTFIPKNSPPHITAQHSLNINHPRPNPPDVQALHNQLDQIKHRQKKFFGDEKKRKRKNKPVILPPSILKQYGFVDSSETQLSPEQIPVYESYPQQHQQPETTTFQPFQVLSQVRQRDTLQHKLKNTAVPVPPPNIRERIKTKQVHTIFNEQGYKDSQFDQGNSEGFRNVQRQKRKRIRNRSRTKRDLEVVANMDDIEEVSELPVALTLMSSNGIKLSGEALLKHLTQLIKNTSKYLPEDTDDESSAKMDAIILEPEIMDNLLKTTVSKSKPDLDVTEPKSTLEIFPFQHLAENESFNEAIDNKSQIPQKFPSILLYNDIMTNIRSMLTSENALEIINLPKRKQERKLKILPIKRAELKLPAHISKYLPKDLHKFFMVKPTGKIYEVTMKNDGTKNKRNANNQHKRKISKVSESYIPPSFESDDNLISQSQRKSVSKRFNRYRRYR